MHQNKLVNEASPYLRQHSNNPVHWLPWGEEAFALARQQDRPIFLSIGYSTCYWCHVMAHESFEDHEVADILNAKFVPIKVDREQRPDVDEVYMTAILALNGHGGWPMSIFLTPNLKPFWGGTYFPKDNFIQILRAIGSAWERERSSIINSASEITHALIERISSADRVATSPSEPVVADLFNHAFSYLQDSFDPAAGGFGEAPKFPPSQSLGFLLRLMATVSQQPLNWNAASALTLLTTTLDRMALGGIFDQLGGGFHRYSTDKNWTVPHFEKMLYDNALLARCYMEAGVYLSRPEYTRIAEATLGYMIRDLKGNLDAFVCAEDAGGPGQEGEFYTFSADELLANFSSAQLHELGAYFNLATPNFEQNRFILTANSFDAQTRASGSQAVSELLAFRASRSRPHRDDKILTSWNGLTISALAIGARFTGNPEYYHHASAAAKFILSQVRVGDVLAHCWCNATVSVPALLEDYAYFIEGLIELHQTELDEFWLSQAVRLAQEAELRLGQPPNALYAPSEARELIYTKHEWSDGAVPAPLSIMAKNLARLARLTGDLAYSDRSTLLQSEIVARIRAHPHTACSLLSGILEQHTDRALLKINLNNKTAQQALRSRFNRSFSPGTLILPLQGESGVMQLCTTQSCQPPIEDLARALSELSTLGSRAAIK